MVVVNCITTVMKTRGITEVLALLSTSHDTMLRHLLLISQGFSPVLLKQEQLKPSWGLH